MPHSSRLGGYAMGMYLMRQIGTRGVYGNPNLPDFMVFLGWKELPWYWYGFDWFGFAIADGDRWCPAVLALVFGWLAFRSRVTGVYLSIITQALTYALLLAFFRNDMGFGGNNGLTDFKDILGFNVQADATRCGLLVISALFLCGAFLLAAVRRGFALWQDPDRGARHRKPHALPGYRPESYKLVVWVLSAIMAGIGGALYVPQVGIINPSEFAPGNSIEAVIWVAVGGRGTLVGAILGAILVNFGKTWFTGALPEIWLYALGAMFIFVTLFLPRGVMGLFRARTPVEPEPEPPRVAASPRGDRMSEARYAALPRWRHRHLRRLPRAERVVAGAGRGRDAGRDRPERRRQDHDDGRHHRQDPARHGQGRVLHRHRPDQAGRTGYRLARDRPQVPEADRVRAAHRSGTICCWRWPATAAKVHHVRPRDAEEKRRIESILETTRLTDQRNRRSADLSHGQKQWLEIGMLLAQEPQLLLVDEPVAGMTDAETEQTAVLLREINRTRSVVVVEHDMAFVRALAVKVTVLHEGSVLSEGSIDFVSDDPKVIEVYLGR